MRARRLHSWSTPALLFENRPAVEQWSMQQQQQQQQQVLETQDVSDNQQLPAMGFSEVACTAALAATGSNFEAARGRLLSEGQKAKNTAAQHADKLEERAAMQAAILFGTPGCDIGHAQAFGAAIVQQDLETRRSQQQQQQQQQQQEETEAIEASPQSSKEEQCFAEAMCAAVEEAMAASLRTRINELLTISPSPPRIYYDDEGNERAANSPSMNEEMFEQWARRADVADRLHLRQPVLFTSNDALARMDPKDTGATARFTGNLNMIGSAGSYQQRI